MAKKPSVTAPKKLPSKKKKSKRNDKTFFARMDSLGDDYVFDLYLECRTVDRLLEELGYRPMAYARLFYKWLHRKDAPVGPDGDTRWDRWKETKVIKAHGHIDEIVKETDAIDEENYKAQRVKIQSHDLLAGHLAPTEYGKKTDVNVNATVTLASEWAASMKELAERQRLARERDSREILVEPSESRLSAESPLALSGGSDGGEDSEA